MPQLPEDELTVAPPRPQSAPTRRRSCRPGTRAWSWKRQDRAVRAIPLAQVSLYAAVRRGRSVPHAPCGARALTGHPHPVLAQAREVKQRLSDRFLAQGARGRERVNTARSDPTAAVTIAYLSPAQGLLRRRRHHWSTCPWWTRRMCRPALSARKISSAPPRQATFSSTRRWNGVRSETRPRALPPTADKVRVLPTGRSRFRRCVALLEREEASSADAVGRARAKMGALDRMRRTQFKSCSVVSIVTSQEARASRRCMYTGGPVSAPATGGVFVTSMSSLLFPSSRWG